MRESVDAGPTRRTPTPSTHHRRPGHVVLARASAAVVAILVTTALATAAAQAIPQPSSPSITTMTAVRTGACPADAVPAAHSVAGHQVGETSCQVTGLTQVSDVHNQPWTEATVALAGTAAGWVETAGSPRSDLVDYPRLLFPQFGDTAWAPATTTYAGSNGLSVLWPNNPAGWNGKTVVLVPGQENTPPIGTLVPRAGQGLDPQTFTNLYAGPLIDHGYSIIYVRRQAASGLSATLADGTTKDTSLNDNVATTVDWIHTAETLLSQSLDRMPSTVLWYGHSSGVIEGRIFNWSGANRNANGTKIINGFLSDDPGGGLPLPLDLPEGQLLGDHDGQITYPPGAGLTAAEKTQMTPELTLAHTEYTPTHTWTTQANYLAEKRAGEQAYERQGLAEDERFDEVAGVSHIANQIGSPPFTLDLEGLVIAQIDNLDAWVTQGTPPPPTIADLQGGNAQPRLGQAVDLPPIACPTGFRYGDPAGGNATQTGYVPFDGHTLEPMTAGGELVDVNGDGYRDALPTLDKAWQSTRVRPRGPALLGKGQHVTKAVYVACVQRDVTSLLHERLLTPAVASWYVQQAGLFPAVPW